jgi:hypothetical protein
VLGAAAASSKQARCLEVGSVVLRSVSSCLVRCHCPWHSGGVLEADQLSRGRGRRFKAGSVILDAAAAFSKRILCFEAVSVVSGAVSSSLTQRWHP